MKRVYESVALLALGLGVGGGIQQYRMSKRLDRVEGTHLFIQSMRSGATDDWKQVVHEIIGKDGAWVRVEKFTPIQHEEAMNGAHIHTVVVQKDQ